jgi:hypothetical protein
MMAPVAGPNWADSITAIATDHQTFAKLDLQVESKIAANSPKPVLNSAAAQH